MKSSDRVNVMVGIWIGFGIAAGIAFAGNAATSVNDIFLAMVFSLAAILGTFIVSRIPVEPSADETLDKAKRGRPDVYNMIDTLDDEELRALRQRLMMDSDNMQLQHLLTRDKEQSRSS